MKPLISVIIPIYNQEAQLVNTIASVVAQTYRPMEVVIVDDGSQKEITKNKLQFPSDIDTVYFRQENKGAPVARNKGFELSKGELVIFWDADIVGNPNMLENMYNELVRCPEASYAYSNFYWGTKKMPAGAFDPVRLKQLNYITTTSLLRREDFPGFDESLKRFQDWDLWLTLLQNGKKGVWIDEYLFTITPGGTMSTWLPRFVYSAPWKWLPGLRKKVRVYEEGRRVVLEKHGL